MRDYLRLLAFLKKHIWTLGAAFASLIVSATFDGITLLPIVPIADRILGRSEVVLPFRLPPFLEGLVATINQTEPLVLLGILCFFGLGLILLKFLFLFLNEYLMKDLSQRLVRDVRNALFEKIQTLSLDYFSEKKAGTLVSRLTYDVSTLQDSVAVGLMDLFYRPLQLFFFACIVFLIHWKLALLSLALIPIITIPVARIGKRLKKVNINTLESMAEINTTLQEYIAGVRIVKVFNMEPYEKSKFEKAAQNFYRYTMKRVKRVIALGPFSECVASIGAILLLLVGGREVVQGTFSGGVLLLFLGALLSLIKPAKKLTSSYGLFQEALGVVPRIFEILDAVPSVVERREPRVLPPIQKNIEFRDVSFRYQEKEMEVLQGISLTVSAGEVIAIVGRSGAGKTTLVNLLPRLYDPTKGNILIDGVELREVTLRSLREQIGVVTQETFLFHDTIEANIAYGRLGSSKGDIVEAARLAHAHDFIMRSPGGYQAVIGERGLKLSGGERQRIAIARAILKNPPLLILDEATSQLDSESERFVQEAIERLMKGRTVFVIAHRLSTIVNANRIVVLEKGRLAEFGTHTELLQRNGIYKKLYSVQFQEVMNT
ncbi:MAG: ABC transporter ATP-binding protein [Candidatus Omnitrophota bacterium]